MSQKQNRRQRLERTSMSWHCQAGIEFLFLPARPAQKEASRSAVQLSDFHHDADPRRWRRCLLPVNAPGPIRLYPVISLPVHHKSCMLREGTTDAAPAGQNASGVAPTLSLQLMLVEHWLQPNLFPPLPVSPNMLDGSLR
jgi:hypothetical protein